VIKMSIDIDAEGINDKWTHAMRNIEKAANVGALSGTPGFVPKPPAYDGMKKPIKTKKLEDKTMEEVMEWLAELQEQAKTEVDKLYSAEYQKGGPGSGIKGHRTAKKKVERKRADKKPDAGYQYAIKQIQAFEKQIVNEPNEHAMIVNGTGDIILTKTTNEEASVGFTADEVVRISISDRTIMTHNHPGASNSFSQADLAFACKYGVTESRVVGKEHTHIFKRKDGAPLDRNYYDEFIGPVYDRIRPLSYDATRSKIMDGSISIDYANTHHSHNIMLELAKTLNDSVIYTREAR